MKLRIATRKSALAMAQSTMAAEEIIIKNKNLFFNNLTYELLTFTTEGDLYLDKSLVSFGGKGVFVKELEIALLEKKADIAIHSLKDMPCEVLKGFKLSAVLKREDPRDAFLSKGGKDGIKFLDLPLNAKVGTGSIRRIVQLKTLRPDIQFIPIRGNIQTRISKLTELDGIVLAYAGLKRMGLTDKVTEIFNIDRVLPASGQGILAIETLENTQDTISKILCNVNDKETYFIALSEMAYLKTLNAGCQFPIASFAQFESVDNLKIRGMYFDEKTNRLIRAECFGVVNDNLSAYNLGVQLALEIKKSL